MAEDISKELQTASREKVHAANHAEVAHTCSAACTAWALLCIIIIRKMQETCCYTGLPLKSLASELDSCFVDLILLFLRL